MKIAQDAYRHTRAPQNRSKTAGTPQAKESSLSPDVLTIVAARDYVIGQEMEVLASVNKLLKSSTEVWHPGLASQVHAQATTASDWISDQATLIARAAEMHFPVKEYLLNSSNGYAAYHNKDSRKDPMDDDRDDATTNRMEGDTNNNNLRGELDGIMDSMGHVLAAMECYQKKVQQIAKDLMDTHEKYRQQEAAADRLSEKVQEVTCHKECAASEAREASPAASWNLQDMTKELDEDNVFLFGSLFPSRSKDEYPEGSEPLIPLSSSSPSTDAFFQSMSSFMGMTSTDDDDASSATTRVKQRTMMNKKNKLEAQLKYLTNVHHVSKACERQVNELDTILAETQDIYNISSKKKIRDKKSSAIIHPPYHEELEAVKYIQEARTKLTEYGALAESLLQDQIKSLVTQYTTFNPDCEAPLNKNDGSDEEAADYAAEFEQLRVIFHSRAYNMDTMEYMRAKSNHDLEEKLLHTLHESVFLRNVSDKCDQEVRVHVGRELSVTVCNIVMSSLTGGGEPHRISECGARLLSKHIRTLHAYVVTFCQCSLPALGRDELLRRVKHCASEMRGASPIDANWKRLFSVLDILKIKQLSQYDQATMLHPLYTTEDARRILSLRTDFDDQDIGRILKTTSRGRAKVRVHRTKRNIRE